jgi:3-hydroxyacyl-CoA dehydrogenase
LWQNKEAILLGIGDQVALYEFRSKANTLSNAVVTGLIEVIDLVEQQDYRGLVIGNEGKHFTVGANLKEMMELGGQYDQIGALISQFQKMIQKIHYAAKPVIVVTHGRVLGGGCEMAMACTHPVADAESYIGLVELAVGLIPAGCGTMRLAAYAHEKASTEHESHIQPYIKAFLETVGTAQVSDSAHQAQAIGFLPNHTHIVMHPDRRLYVAKEEVIRLSNEGYAPPPVRNAIKVLGAPGRAEFEITAHNMLRGRFISDYDAYLAERLAYVMTGGDLTGSAWVHENYLLELECEVFLSLLGEEKTQARIHSILTRNKPLRN